MKINKLIISLLISLFWVSISTSSVLAQPSIGRKDPPTSEPSKNTPPSKTPDKPDVKPDPPKNPPRNATSYTVKKAPSKNRPKVTADGVPINKNTDFYFTEGTRKIDDGEFELALKYFDQVDNKKRKGATPELLDLLEKHTQVAKLHIEADETDDAQKAVNNYLEILKLRPTDPKSKELLPDLYNKIVDAALNSKDYDRAVENLDLLLALNPENSTAKEKLLPALLGQGEVAIEANNDVLAQKSFRRALTLDTNNSLAQQKLRLLDLRGLLEFAENKLKAEAYEDAMLKFKEALSIDPENEQAKRGAKIAEGNYQKLKAEQLYTNRKFSDSERFYQAALAILPDDEKIKARLEEIAIRLRPNTPPRGKSIWSGKINSSSKIKITGKEIMLDGSGDGTINERLPELGFLVKKVKPISGGVPVKIVEQPSATNKYSATFAVDTKKPKDVSFEIEWELKRQGKITWRGQINGKSIVRIQGPFVDLEQVSEGTAKDISYESDPLPSQEAIIKITKLSGAPEVRLIEAPSSLNSYIATLEIESSGTEPEPLAFQIEWSLK